MAKYIPALTLVICLTSAVQAQETTKPLGKWERKIGKTHVTLFIDDNRLHITYAGDKLGTLHADYAMTHDGLIYGVITSIECDEDEEADAAKTLFDTPFSFRFRLDEGALIIHDANMYAAAGNKDEVWNGRYNASRPAASRAAVVPTSYYGAPAYLAPSSAPCTAPPPCPIAPSFSSPKSENTQPNNIKEVEKVFNFWMGYVR